MLYYKVCSFEAIAHRAVIQGLRVLAQYQSVVKPNTPRLFFLQREKIKEICKKMKSCVDEKEEEKQREKPRRKIVLFFPFPRVVVLFNKMETHTHRAFVLKTERRKLCGWWGRSCGERRNTRSHGEGTLPSLYTEVVVINV